MIEAIDDAPATPPLPAPGIHGKATPALPPPGIDAAAEFERWLEQAHDEYGGAAASSPDAPERDGDTAALPQDATADDADLARHDDIDARFAPPTWAALSLTTPTEVPALAAAPQPAPPPAWAEVSACIERLLVTDPGGRAEQAAALFRVAPELLRETTLALRRSGSGWLLRIDSQDDRLHVDAARHEAALRERFACAGLGELVIERGELPDLPH